MIVLLQASLHQYQLYRCFKPVSSTHILHILAMCTQQQSNKHRAEGATALSSLFFPLLCHSTHDYNNSKLITEHKLKEIMLVARSDEIWMHVWMNHSVPTHLNSTCSLKQYLTWTFIPLSLFLCALLTFKLCKTAQQLTGEFFIVFVILYTSIFFSGSFKLLQWVL